MTGPQFPIYIVSKGRAAFTSRLTARCLDEMGVPFRVVVEIQEREAYASAVGAERVLVLDPGYQETYDTFDQLGASKSRGPGPARNFVWDHAVAEGHAWHWVMDDNLRYFFRLNHNSKVLLGDGTCFRAMEDFVLRYSNVAMAGPQYEMFCPRKKKWPPFVINTRIYSCNLIRCDTGFRWRGRYNEDTDLSLRMLKAGWCTIQFNAFLQHKIRTQNLAGGNTDAFYAKEGTVEKSRMLAQMHPDVARLKHRYSRDHHYVDYTGFRQVPILKPGLEIAAGVDNYGMAIEDRPGARAVRRKV